MAAIYKTPGVYVEEIVKFPPSIAPVETSIPAFIGYTENAIRNGESLINKPTSIESIAEYEEIFGGGPNQNVIVYLDNDNNFVKGEAEGGLYLYDSLRMFYANGGGNCYIVSVGKYPEDNTEIKEKDIKLGLSALEQEDEPTIIVLPDAVSIPSGPYSMQQLALAQCNKLMDRIVLCDIVKQTDSDSLKEKIKKFRSDIGINFLKYGVAYAPWININLPQQIWHKNLKLKRYGSNDDIKLESLTTDVNLLDLVRDTKLSEGTAVFLREREKNLSGAQDKVLEDALKTALDGYNVTSDNSTVDELSNALKKITELIFSILEEVYSVKKEARKLGDINGHPYPDNTKFELTKNITNFIVSNSEIKDSVLSIVKHHNYHKKEGVDFLTTGFLEKENFNNIEILFDIKPLTLTTISFIKEEIDKEYPVDVDTLKKRADKVRDAAYVAAENAIRLFNSTKVSIYAFEKNLNNSLLAAFGKFKELVTKGAEALNLLPPSGAIAGIYATVDRERGVWKAPANVSLNAVISPAVKISHEQQAEYNVDVNSGKSINIIRSFTGKGTLVWGARTLAGNDNEWRYINVRRFFNFAEESIKKATEQFVFEPNDANTWVRVQAMIENFLTTLWRQGALQGVKPEHAFYVAVGLGKTMTALDIQEGRMIIEIGMAVVRPAEFIILKFSHKMAES